MRKKTTDSSAKIEANENKPPTEFYDIDKAKAVAAIISENIKSIREASRNSKSEVDHFRRQLFIEGFDRMSNNAGVASKEIYRNLFEQANIAAEVYFEQVEKLEASSEEKSE